MITEPTWIHSATEVPISIIPVEPEDNGAVISVRYRGLDRWETLDGNQTDVPVAFRRCEPSSTGHFMR